MGGLFEGFFLAFLVFFTVLVFYIFFQGCICTANYNRVVRSLGREYLEGNKTVKFRLDFVTVC